jgi:vacuolar-type H+-ATPase subunit I/STV1
MTTFLTLLSFLLLIALIIGLIKPEAILRWSKKPTRLKVFGFWILATLIIVIISPLTDDNAVNSSGKLKTAKNLIELEHYEDAISKLKEIEKDDSLYVEAKELLTEAEKLMSMTEAEKIKLKEAEEKKKAEEEKAATKEQLKREIESINEGVDFSSYRGTIDALQLEIALFATWTKIIEDAEIYEDEAINNLTQQLKSKVASIQIREFPILRKEYTKIVASKLWENDIEVSSNGTGNRYINFTGGVFAANKNKKDFQNEIHEILTMFRFNQARYRWYEGQDKYTYWSVYEGKDSDLVDFK